jgi:hypothetical protein
MSVTGKKAAHTASEIMALAKKGGPILGQADEINTILACGSHDKAKLQKLDALLRPYIDGAESVAASALKQREPKQ